MTQCGGDRGREEATLVVTVTREVVVAVGKVKVVVLRVRLVVVTVCVRLVVVTVDVRLVVVVIVTIVVVKYWYILWSLGDDH
jgi:hypothetical protein